MLLWEVCADGLADEGDAPHGVVELRWGECLGAVGPCLGRVVVDLDLKAVSAGRAGRVCGRAHVAGVAGGVARVSDDGKVREVVQDGDGVDVKGVAGARLEGADAALAEHDVGVALAHDVLGAHQQLVDGLGHAALEKDRHLGLSDLLEQGEVLGVARADLHDLDAVVEEGLDVARVHDLGHDGHPELGSRLHEQVEAALTHALVGVGGGAGLVGAAAQDGGPGRLDRAGNL